MTPRQPAVADDIVTRLYDLLVGPWAYVIGPVAEDAADEIERLRAALALAVGELSGHPPHTSTHPDELMHQLLEEARHG